MANINDICVCCLPDEIMCMIRYQPDAKSTAAYVLSCAQFYDVFFCFNALLVHLLKRVKCILMLQVSMLNLSFPALLCRIQATYLPTCIDTICTFRTEPRTCFFFVFNLLFGYVHVRIFFFCLFT